MKEYFGTLLCVACVCGIAEMLSPRGKNDGLRSHVKFICALSIVCVVAAPIGSILNMIREGGFVNYPFDDGYIKESQYQSVFREYVEAQNASVLSDHLESELCQKFEISSEDIEVSVRLLSEDDVYGIESITVFIGVKAIAKDPHLIIEYVRSKTNVECEIIYK